MLLTLALLVACTPDPAPSTAVAPRLDPQESWSWSPADDVAGAGYAVSPAGDVDADGIRDLWVTAPRADGAGSRLGVVHLFLGVGGGFSSEPHQTWWGPRNFSEWGRNVIGDVDLNGDGWPDVVMIDGGANTAHVFLGGAAGIMPAADQQVALAPTESALRAAAADFNGDGRTDVAFANRAEQGAAGVASGRVRVFYGAASGLDDANPTVLEGPSVGGLFGQSVAAGDVDDDGYADLIVGAGGHDIGLLQDAGQVLVFSGSAAGLAGTASRSWAGDLAAEQLGDAVASGGDVDGDGVDDVVMTRPSRRQNGLSGQVSVWRSSTDTLVHLTASDFVELGSNVVILPDTDADGRDEVVATAFGSGWVAWSIAADGAVTESARFTQVTSGSNFGWGLAAMDADQDGSGDLVVGAPDASVAASGSGVVRLFRGGAALVDDDGDDDGVHADVDCDDADPAVGGPTRFYRDGDHDGVGYAGMLQDRCTPDFGYVAGSGDCDDARDDVYPGAPEACDGVDQDCDGDIDEDAADAAERYRDGDGDGVGAGAPTLGCASDGWVLVDGDCDDTSVLTGPGFDELCDSVDNDCDGDVDEDAVAVVHYADADGDGWGDASSAAVACDLPAGRVRVDGDCNDVDPAKNPDQAELCAAGDEDCDGVEGAGAVDAVDAFVDGDNDGVGGVSARLCSVGPGFASVGGDCDDGDPARGGPVPVYQDLDEDGVGNAGAAATSCAPGRFDALVPGDCNDYDPAIAAGFDEVCGDGKDNDCDEALDEECATDAEDTDTDTTDAEGTDAEPTDAEPTDADTTDAEPTDAEPTDAEPTDAEPTDAEPTDAEPTDAEPTDAEPTDAEPTDAEPTDAETTDAPEPSDVDDEAPEKGGCACDAGGSGGSLSLSAAALLVALRRRRR